jgi:hypothetical protein
MEYQTVSDDSTLWELSVNQKNNMKMLNLRWWWKSTLPTAESTPRAQDVREDVRKCSTTNSTFVGQVLAVFGKSTPRAYSSLGGSSSLDDLHHGT